MSAPLRELQRSFALALRRRTRGPLRAIAAGPSSTPVLCLAVYVDAYRARLAEVLAGDYPALRAWLGGDAFERLAHRYVDAHPSRHPNLNRFGERLPAFLARRGPRAPFATSLARFELAVTRAFDAAETAPLARDALAALPAAAWRDARLVVHPSVHVLRVPAAVVDHFAAWRGTSPPRAERRGDVHVMVWRCDGEVVHAEMPRAIAFVLRRLMRGDDLAHAVGDDATRRPAANELQQWFARWRRDGVFAAVR